MLFNEPKLLKSRSPVGGCTSTTSFSALQRAEIAEIYQRSSAELLIGCFSALQRAEIAEISNLVARRSPGAWVSVLFNEPKLLKCACRNRRPSASAVSVLFNEPKLLKFGALRFRLRASRRFSALQRAEIAEMLLIRRVLNELRRFSALQRAEIAEILGDAARRSADPLFQCSSTSRNC